MLVRYRKDYTGESVTLSRELYQGRWIETTEWVENTVEFYPRSLSAVVLGDNTLLDANILKSKQFTTYSINQDTQFSLEKNQSSVCYASLETILANPGDYHLIPYNPGFDQMASLVYLAAFDGHKQIYLLGVDETPNLLDLVSSYSSVEFIKVSLYGRDTVLPQLQYHTNYKQISRVDFDLDITVPVPAF